MPFQPRSTSCGACAPGSTPAWSCRRRITRGATALPRDARETVSRILDRLDGDYARGRVGLRRGLRRARRARLRVPLRDVVASAGDRRRARAGARPRAPHVEPRGHPSLGRHHDLDGAAARASAPALPALPRPQLGIRPAVDLGRDAQGRRRGGLAVQRDAAARAGPSRGRLPRGREGDGQAVLGALPAPALRPRRLRRDRAPHRRADRAGGGRGQRGDLPEARRPAGRGAPDRGALLSRSRRPSRCSDRSGSCRSRRSGGSSSSTRSKPPRTGRRAPTTGRSCSSCPSACATRSSRLCTRTSYEGVLPSSNGPIWPILK